jgi:transglutaminase-like putative cysteine protease
VIYDVRHVTRYDYGAPVAVNTCALHLLLRSLDGQIVLASRINVTPSPIRIEERPDMFGNRVTHMRIETPHRELVIEAVSRVRVDRPPPPMAGITPTWESVAADSAAAQSLAPDSPAFTLYPSRLVEIFDGATRYARESFRPARPIFEAALELNKRIKADFLYDSKATAVTTTPAQAFANRRGVCQDFAHVMIAALRGVGLSARYVSGYIRTIPPPGKKRLQGADAMHAWVSVWCGGDVGWVDLDPTNGMLIGNDHIVLARGRDYADISPVAGIILGTREQDVDVEVDVIPRGKIEAR